MFTLIIPYHNRAKVLSRTLQSIVRCTVLPHQIILVDNASTDDSAQLCQSFAEAHPELPILLINEPRRRASIARNAGLGHVTTEWVYFFDSDDELSPEYFATVQQYVATHPDLDLVASATTMCFPDGREVRRQVLYSDSAADQLLSAQLATQGMFIRTSFLRKVGGWNEQVLLWDDYELGFRLLHHGARTAWLTDCAWHRIYQHQESITGNDYTSRHEQIVTALTTISQQLQPTERALWLALAFRQVLIAGKLANEESRQVSNTGKLANEESRQVSNTGKLDNEGSRKLSRLYYRQALSRAATSSSSASQLPPSFPHLPSPRLSSFFLRLLYHYTRLGGRGAWLIATKLTHWLGKS